MQKSWIRALILFVAAAACWYGEIVINPSNFEVILGFATMVTSILCICFLAIAIIKSINSNASGYKIFAWTDSLIGIGVLAYAIYDIVTATGWFAGLVGMLLIIFVIPVILVLLIIDYVLYRINKISNRRKYLSKDESLCNGK